MSRSSRRRRREQRADGNRQESGPAAAVASAPGGERRSVLLAAWILVASGLVVWAGSFQGVFVLDDEHAITDNQAIRTLWPPWEAMFAPTQGNRPLVGLSLAVNYALGGIDPWGYHAVNLAVHLAAALALFGLVRRTLLLDRLKDRFGGAATPLAFAVALLWMAHPLQTESVTYVVQRAESMMGLMMLLALYLSLRGFTSARPWPWYAGAVAACAAGMGTKEVMIVAPVVVIAYDMLVVTGSLIAPLRRRWPFYLLLACTWLLLAPVIYGRLVAPVVTGETPTAGEDIGGALTPSRYAVTQLAVVTRYLRLSLWPAGLRIEYEWPLADSIRQVWPQALLMLVLVGGTLWAAVRRRPLAFLGVWLFVILAPTSSILPVEDPVVEHRMYAPLAAVVALIILGGYACLAALLRHAVPKVGTRRRAGWVLGVVLVAAAAVPLAAATIERNRVYHSALALWTDAVAKEPDSLTVQNNLGVCLAREGRLEEALKHYRIAASFNPKNAGARNNLGVTLAELGRLDEAIVHLKAAVRRYEEYLATEPGNVRNQAGLTEARRNLLKALVARGWQLATSHDAADRDGPRALEMATLACRMTDQKEPECFKVLAVAQAEVGDFSQAIAAAGRAAELYRQAGRQDQVDMMTNLAGLFRRNRPYHQPAPRP